MEALAEALRGMQVTCSLRALDVPLHAPVAVVDSYEVRADDTDAVSAAVVVAVDDLDRDLAVDILVDPTPGADTALHPSAHVVLAGADHVLIGPGLPEDVAPPADDVRRVLVTMGGGQAGAALGMAVAADLLRRRPDLDVRVAVGPWSEASAPPGITPIRTTSGLGGSIAEVDLVVTAAGVTLLESLALGRPTVAIVIADNQRRAAAAIAGAHAAVVVGADDAAQSTSDLLDDVERRRALAAAGPALVDRRGPGRVARAVREAIDERRKR